MSKTHVVPTFVFIISSLCSVFANTFHVTPGGSGNLSGVSWTDSANLHTALGSAISGDQVWLASGNYYPGALQTDTFNLTEGVTLLGGFNGSETTESQRSWSSHQTILSGGIGAAGVTDNTNNIVTVSGNGVRMDGLIIEQGHGVSGAGIYAYHVNGFVLENSIIRNNYGSSDGGGAYLLNDSSTTAPNIVRNCYFIGNEAAFDAGGLYFRSSRNGSDEDHLYNCIFVNNKAVRAGAGVLFMSSGNTYNLTFYGNEDPNGTDDSNDAGQLAISGSSSRKIVNSVFQGPVNTKDLSTWKTGPPKVILTNSIVSNNTIGQIGTSKTYTFDIGDGVVTENSTIFNNPAASAGPDNLYFTQDDGLNILSSSNVVNQGVLNSPTTDHDIIGNPRDSNPDFGAFEVLTPMSDNLIAWFSFNETSGNVATDSSNRMNDGNLFGGFSFDSASQPGVSGNALEFDNSGDRVIVPSIADYDLTAGIFTFSAWLKPYDDQSGHAMIVSRENPMSYDFGFNTNGYPYFAINNGASWVEYTGSSATLSTNQWHNYVVTRDAAGTLSFYLGGTLSNSITGTVSPASSNADLWIGSRYDLNLLYHGLIDEIKIYNRALSPAEIQSDFNALDPLSNGPLVFTLLQPANYAANVPVGANLIIQFEESISLNAGNLMIFENGNIIHQYNSTSTELSVTANKLYINPIADLAHNSNYYVKIDNGLVTGASGNTFGGFSYPTEWNFYTQAPTAPAPLTFNLLQPPNNDTNVYVGTNLIIQFDESISLATGNLMIFENGNIIHQYNSTSAELSVTANKLYIEPIADLAHNSNYHVKIDNGFVTGASGNTFGGFSYPTEWNFHTEAAPVTTFTGSLIAAGRATVFIADPNGSALSRGRQEKGQLGRVGDASIFASIGLPANPVSISVGESHGLALTTDGNVFSWGDGSHGQAHSGTAQEETSISSKVVFIEAGSNSSFVITDNNQLWAKGHNHMGQLGVGDSADKAVWTQVTLPAGNIQAVSSGVEHTLVLIDGKVFGFGSDGFRQLNQSGGLHTTPVAVLSGSDWTRVEVGGFHSIVEKQSGGLFGFGKNDRGQLGLGHTQAVVQPEQPITLPGSISQIVDFAAGFDHTVVIVNHLGATRVLGTGSNHFGQTSIAGASSSVNFLNADPMINNAVEVDAGPHSTLIFSSANVLMGTGVLSNQLKPKLEFLIDNN